MSEESDDVLAVDTSGETQRLTVEYKDGQLQIVEVTPYEAEKSKSILPDMESSENMQVQKFIMDPEKGLMQLDLLNLTLVRCDDGGESYRLVTNADAEGSDLSTDATVTCVLQSSDGEDPDSQESYVMMQDDQGLVFLQSALQEETNQETLEEAPEETLEETKETYTQADSKPTKSTYVTVKPVKENAANKLTPQELLARAKALQKAKNICVHTRIGKRGRRRKGELPPPQQLLASPDFKLFLYSCKLCSYKCNAIKELAAHRASEHGHGQSGRPRGAPSRGQAITLQCARCPFRGSTHSLLMKHVNNEHLNENVTSNKVSLDSKEVEEADVLVCGACGFESGDKGEFRTHIVEEHGATTT